FNYLETQERGTGNEIQLTDAMLKLMRDQPFYGTLFEGQTFDCGSKEGFVEANLAFALSRHDLHDHIAKTASELLASTSPLERRIVRR
ncbi:MAG: UTP--glucose-1-phosphate uridylyltransferase, partial [Rhizobiaceae bacterium]